MVHTNEMPDETQRPPSNLLSTSSLQGIGRKNVKPIQAKALFRHRQSPQDTEHSVESRFGLLQLASKIGKPQEIGALVIKFSIDREGERYVLRVGFCCKSLD